MILCSKTLFPKSSFTIFRFFNYHPYSKTNSVSKLKRDNKLSFLYWTLWLPQKLLLNKFCPLKRVCKFFNLKNATDLIVHNLWICHCIHKKRINIPLFQNSLKEYKNKSVRNMEKEGTGHKSEGIYSYPILKSCQPVSFTVFKNRNL